MVIEKLQIVEKLFSSLYNISHENMTGKNCVPFKINRNNNNNILYCNI